MFVQKFKKKCINRKMFKRAFYILSLIFLFFIYGAQPLFAEVIKKIQILGNERIPEATIKALSSIQINQEIQIVILQIDLHC